MLQLVPCQPKKKGGVGAGGLEEREDFFFFGVGENLFWILYCSIITVFIFGRLFSVSVPSLSYMVFLVALSAPKGLEEHEKYNLPWDGVRGRRAGSSELGSRGFLMRTKICF